MPKKGWTNISVSHEEFDRLKRLYTSYYDGHLDWSKYIRHTIESSLLKAKIAKTKFPHLKFVDNTETGCIIEDTKKNKVVVLSWKNGMLVSNEGDPSYVLFALFHPSLRLNG